jgi:hypothetical protein
MPKANLVDLKIELPDDETAAANKFLAIAESASIDNAEEMVLAQQARAMINTQLKDLNEKRLGITRPIDAAKLAVMKLFAPATSTLEQALKKMDAKIIAYDDLLETQRIDAQRKADEKAEADRKRLLEAADRNAAKGNDKKAAEFEDRAAMTVAPVIAQRQVRAAGVSIPKVWKHRILDASKIVRTFMAPDEKKIASTVKSLGKEAVDVIGAGSIEVFQEAHIASGRAT